MALCQKLKTSPLKDGAHECFGQPSQETGKEVPEGEHNSGEEQDDSNRAPSLATLKQIIECSLMSPRHCPAAQVLEKRLKENGRLQHLHRQVYGQTTAAHEVQSNQRICGIAT